MNKAGGGNSGGNAMHTFLIVLLILGIVAAVGGTAFLVYKKVHKPK